MESWNEVDEPVEVVEQAGEEEEAEEAKEEEQSVVDSKMVKPRKKWSFYVQVPRKAHS